MWNNCLPLDKSSTADARRNTEKIFLVQPIFPKRFKQLQLLQEILKKAVYFFCFWCLQRGQAPNTEISYGPIQQRNSSTTPTVKKPTES